MDLGLIESLTPREREILTHIADGKSLAEIAQSLHRSLKTIESHRLSLGRKLNVSNRVELAKIAIAAGLVEVPNQGHADSNTTSSTGPNQAAIELSWLKQINAAVEMAVGGEYLRQFCQAASQLPGARVAAICTPDPHQTGEVDIYLRCVMAGADQGVTLDPVRYDAHQTPCEQIIEQGNAIYERGVLQAYPQDKLLQAFKAESYLGIQLIDSEGATVGGVGIIGDQAIEDLSPHRRVLEFFAPRVAAELGQHRRIEQLRGEQMRIRTELEQREQQLRSMHNNDDEEPTVQSRIARRVDHMVGERFLHALTDAICDECGVELASICTPTQVEGEPGFYTLAFSEKGKQTDPIWIKHSASACAVLDTQRMIVCGENAPARFPHCAIAVEGNYQAYIGIRLELEGEKESCGSMWVLNRTPIADTSTIEAVLIHYAARVAAEVDQSTYIKRLHNLQKSLQSKASDNTQTLHTGDHDTVQEMLLELQQRVNPLAGPSFIRGVTDALCSILGMRYVGICLSEQINGEPGFYAISLSEQGRQIDTLRYLIKGTPCEKTVEQDFFCCPMDVARHFPEDDLLINMNIDSYVGICLTTHTSGRIGILWGVDNKPVTHVQRIEAVFNHLQPRLSAELERFIEMEELRTEREQLESRIANSS